MCYVHIFLLQLFQQAPCGQWSGSTQIQHMHASIQSNGQILVNSDQTVYCVTEHTDFNRKLRALTTSNAACQASASLFRLVEW